MRVDVLVKWTVNDPTERLVASVLDIQSLRLVSAEPAAEGDHPQRETSHIRLEFIFSNYL